MGKAKRREREKFEKLNTKGKRGYEKQILPFADRRCARLRYNPNSNCTDFFQRCRRERSYLPFDTKTRKIDHCITSRYRRAEK